MKWYIKALSKIVIRPNNHKSGKLQFSQERERERRIRRKKSYISHVILTWNI